MIETHPRRNRHRLLRISITTSRSLFCRNRSEIRLLRHIIILSYTSTTIIITITSTSRTLKSTKQTPIIISITV
ncbi:hypothetical protein Hanom_Chr13g01227551 [Helianthus anomalus]